MKLSKETIELAKQLEKSIKADGFEVESDIKCTKIHINTFIKI